MLKYDYFSTLCELTDKSREAVEYACKKRTHAYIKISRIRAESYKTLCELEHALFSEFLPPLDRSSIAAYAHALCSIVDCAIAYASLSPISRPHSVKGGFEGACISLCELLSEGTSMIESIKKSSDTPKLEEFREKKGQTLNSLCEWLVATQNPHQPQLFSARQELLSSISSAFDTLIELILKNI